MFLQPGTTLGPYEVIEPIRVGGMGEVYRARDTKLNRDVALKVLPEAFVTDPERLARFQREAEVLASLNHPNMPRFMDSKTAVAPPRSSSSSSKVRRSPIGLPKDRSRSMRLSRSRNKSPKRWKPRTSRASSIAI